MQEQFSVFEPFQDRTEGRRICGLFWAEYKLSTATYCAVFWSFGLCVAFLGPTVWDLQCQTHSEPYGKTWLLFSQTSLMLLGSLVTGLILVKVSVHMVLLFGVLVPPAMFILIPFSRSFAALASVLAIMGFHMGLVDTAANVAMIDLYGEHVSPFLQAMHLCYGLGAWIGPTISAQFLHDDDCANFHYENKTQLFMPARRKFTPRDEVEHTVEIQYAFWIMAGLQIPVIILVMCLMIQKRNKGSKSVDIHEKDAHVLCSPSNCFPGLCLRQYKSTAAMIIILSCLLMFASDGLQGGYSGYVYSYGKKVIYGLSASDAANLESAFWGCFSLGRLLAVIGSIWLKPLWLLGFDVVGCLLAMSAVSVLPTSHVLLLVVSCFMGLFISSTSPAVLSFCEKHIGLTASATSCLVFIAALGEVCFPMMIGNIMADFGPEPFIYASFANTGVALALFVGIVMIAIVRSQSPENNDIMESRKASYGGVS